MRVVRCFLFFSFFAGIASARPNILFITVDDMSADSVGVYGCPVQSTTPNIDRFAEEGIRFEHAHVQAPNCTPSRNVFQTGLYPHRSRIEGFYDVEFPYPLLPDLLRKCGYRTGIWGKVADSTPRSNYAWDKVIHTYGKGMVKSAEAVGKMTKNFIKECQQQKKPFYLMMNISDPHQPLYGSKASAKKGYDLIKPSYIFSEGEVVVPDFLPDLPAVRREVTQYYNSVRRADDIFGGILQALAQSGEASNTLVVFVSDHGMPLPFAKTQLYRQSTQTPWIMRFPDRIPSAKVDREHMISAIDFMPTILGFCNIKPEQPLDGRSLLPLLDGRKESNRNKVFKEFHENAKGVRNPMRAVETLRYLYIFNPWSDGERLFKSATLYTATYKAMEKAAAHEPGIAARIEHFNHRVCEEFYDLEKDPYALNNLMDDSDYKRMVQALRSELEAWMEQRKDPALEVFRNPGSVEIQKIFIEREEAKSKRLNHSPLERKRKL